VAPFKQGIELHESTTDSQTRPVAHTHAQAHTTNKNQGERELCHPRKQARHAPKKPVVHAHVKPEGALMQEPAFWHGWEEQESNKNWHVGPENRSDHDKTRRDKKKLS